MPLKLNFSKVNVISFSRKAAGGTAKISCSPTKSVQKAMGWDEFPDWQTSSTPKGRLAASTVEFTPTQADLSKFACQITTTAVRDFELIRKQVKNGKSATKAPTFRTELHCSVDFIDPEGGTKLEQYMQAPVGDSTMRVTYEREPEQQDLPGVDPTSDGQQELEEIVQDAKRKRATAKESD